MVKKYNYIIGDIHGCYEELLELEQKIRQHSSENKAEPFVISCGDLVDRGPYSRDVLEHFSKGMKNNSHTAIAGNHEVMLLQSYEFFSDKKLPLPFPEIYE